MTVPEKNVLLTFPDAKLYFWPQFLNSAQADLVLNQLIKTVAWHSDKIKVFRKEHLLPRLTAWYRNAGKTCRYAGIPTAATARIAWAGTATMNRNRGQIWL